MVHYHHCICMFDGAASTKRQALTVNTICSWGDTMQYPKLIFIYSVCFFVSRKESFCSNVISFHWDCLLNIAWNGIVVIQTIWECKINSWETNWINLKIQNIPQSFSWLAPWQILQTSSEIEPLWYLKQSAKYSGRFETLKSCKGTLVSRNVPLQEKTLTFSQF